MSRLSAHVSALWQRLDLSYTVLDAPELVFPSHNSLDFICIYHVHLDPKHIHIGCLSAVCGMSFFRNILDTNVIKRLTTYFNCIKSIGCDNCNPHKLLRAITESAEAKIKVMPLDVNSTCCYFKAMDLESCADWRSRWNSFCELWSIVCAPNLWSSGTYENVSSNCENELNELLIVAPIIISIIIIINNIKQL